MDGRFDSEVAFEWWRDIDCFSEGRLDEGMIEKEGIIDGILDGALGILGTTEGKCDGWLDAVFLIETFEDGMFDSEFMVLLLIPCLSSP